MRYSPVTQLLRRLTRDCRAATAVEYGLILSMVVLAMLAALQEVGTTTKTMWDNVADQVTTAH